VKVSAELWDTVEGLVDRLIDHGPLDPRRIEELREHRMHLLVAERLRMTGAEVPSALRAHQRLAALTALAVPVVLARARSAFDGELILMKGAEVGTEYPRPVTRPFVDLDLLASDPHAAQRALLAAGFVASDDPAWLDCPEHQLTPLHLPGLAISVEIHRHPHWVDRLTVPSWSEIREAARPSALGVDGLLAPAPEHHALLLAVHAWVERPLGRLGSLLDIAAMRRRADEHALNAIARLWRCRRLWRATRAATDAVLESGRQPSSLKVWARHLPEARDRTVLAAHLQRLLAPAWALPGLQAVTGSAAAAVQELRPGRGERWIDQAWRMRQAAANARLPESSHLAQAPPPGTRRR
jgi:hypothetical protein